MLKHWFMPSLHLILSFSKKSSHITPILHRLNWLPVRFHIQYKILLSTFKALHGLPPPPPPPPAPCISDLIHIYSPVHTLRSSDTGLLLIPHHGLHHLVDERFVSLSPHSGILFPNTFVIFLHYRISKPTSKHIFSFLVSLISGCMVWFMPWLSCLSVRCF